MNDGQCAASGAAGKPLLRCPWRVSQLSRVTISRSPKRLTTPVSVDNWEFAADVELLVDEANSHFAEGQIQEAIGPYTRVIAAAPEVASAWYNRANAYAALGMADEADNDYARALALDPQDADAIWNRSLLGSVTEEARPAPIEQPSFAKAAQPRVAAIVAAHNEERIIAQAIDSLLAQTRALDLIVIASDNSTDRTVSIASEYAQKHPNVFVFETSGNTAKKAGALNQAMARVGVDSFDYFFQMDADSVITKELIEEGLYEMSLDDRIGGLCSSAYLMPAEKGTGLFGRVLWRLQNIEYGFAQAWRMESPDDSRVLAGIGSLLRGSALKDIEQARGDGQYWNEQSIVEDYVIGLAMKDRGWRVKPAPRMVLFTEGQTTVATLWRQRLRWYTGTINEVRKRKLRQHSRQELFGILLALFCLAIRLAVLTFVGMAIAGVIHLDFNLWMIALPLFTLAHNAYRLKYVHQLDGKQAALALSVFPMDIYDTFQQVTYLVSTVRSYRGANAW